MKRSIALCLCISMLLACLFGCARKSGPDSAEPDSAGKIVISQSSASNAKGLLEPSEAIFQDGKNVDANEFAFRLSAILSDGKENRILSPFSVWMALSAITNAVEGGAQKELLRSLGMESTSVNQVNNGISAMLYSLFHSDYAEDGYSPLSIANAVFVDQNAKLRREFAQTFMDYYRGTAFNVDFKSPESAAAVNRWAAEQTEGLIEDIVQEFDPETVVALANAIYFSDRWAWEFDPAKTSERPFYGADHESKAQFMLREGDSQPYYEDDALQAIPLRFQLGGSLYILLPRDGDAHKLMQSMTAERFSSITEQMQHASGRLLLPRFEMESFLSLNEPLRQLGVPLFDAGSPQISKLVEGENLFINAALHKAAIRVDEKGTTAAAVTVMAMAGAGLPEPTAPFSMVCDRPFVIVLTTYVPYLGEQVLFTGVVNQL